MTNSMKGLRLKPSYEQLIGVAVSDDVQHFKFPNRDATFVYEMGSYCRSLMEKV